MYSIKDLEDSLGLTYDQLRSKIVNLEDNFDNCVERGQRGKYLVTEKGLSLLRKINELENNGHSLETATKVIKKDLTNTDENGGKIATKEGNINTELVQELRNRIEHLETENQRLWKNLDRRDHQIQQLLPAPDKKEVLRHKSLWQVIREWLKQPATG